LTGDAGTDEAFIGLLGWCAENKGCSAGNGDIQHNALSAGEVHDMAQQRSTARRGHARHGSLSPHVASRVSSRALPDQDVQGS